jgi:hypothetical protein
MRCDIAATYMEAPITNYTIRHDPVREKKGLKSWGVFEQVSDDFARGVSQHSTMQEALTAKSQLEKDWLDASHG